MPNRPRVIDLHEPYAHGPLVCPGCGVGLDWVRRNDLRTIRVQCRCRLGHVVYEVRCRACAALVIVRDGETGLVVVRLGNGIDDGAREHIASTIEDRYARGR